MNYKLGIDIEVPLSANKLIKHFVDEAEKRAVSGIFVPENCNYIKIDLKIIFDPKEDKEEFHSNIRTHGYGVDGKQAESYSWFKNALHNDLMDALEKDQIPDRCEKIFMKIDFEYCNNI